MTGHQDLHEGEAISILHPPQSDAAWFYLAHALYGSHKDVIKYNERSTFASDSDPQWILFCDSPDCWAKILILSSFLNSALLLMTGGICISMLVYLLRVFTWGPLASISEMYSL